jgi:hypothetical protein
MTYTKEQIIAGFEKWNNYIANGGKYEEYDAKSADPAQQDEWLISFMNIPEPPKFPNNVPSKGEG